MVLIFKRIGLFIVPFSVVFWLIHYKFEDSIVNSIKGGLSGFYAADSLIFGLIVAFVINREWERWTHLSQAVAAELDAVREMWKWCALVPESARGAAHEHLTQYLKTIVSEWENGVNVRSANVDKELNGLRAQLTPMANAIGALGFHFTIVFTTLVQARDKRLTFSNENMPGILKRIVFFAGLMFIFLSLFIAVNNIYIDYIFTAAIGLLAFSLLLVVDDLDSPFRPGTWHLTPKGYLDLLTELTQIHK